MLKSLLNFIVCPNCNSHFRLSVESEDVGRVLEGKFFCSNSSCGSVFMIRDGFPDLTVFKFEEEKKVAKSFGFEWGSHHKGKIEEKRVFGRTIDEDLNMFFEISNLTPQELHEKTILDVGCGSAKLTKALTRYSPRFTLGTDINEATYLSHKYCSDSNKCQVLRADVFNLPIENESIDIGWSNGVLHHTPDAKVAFHSLAAKIKPGGRLSIWVYKKGFYPFVFISDFFRFFQIDHLPYNILFYICKIFSVFSIMLHSLYRIIFWLPIKLVTANGNRLDRTMRFRPYDEFLMTWFDALSPSYNTRHSKEEVENWFKECGFGDLKFWNNQIGMSGTKLK